METETKRNFLQSIQHRIDSWVASTTNRLSPLTRVLLVLIIGGALFLYSVFFILHSMYNLGTRSARVELIEQQKDDSRTNKQVNIESYEYN